MRAVAAASTVGRSRVFKILHLDECPASPMEPGRGEQIKLINSRLGTEKVDVHLNRLVAGGPRGKHHHHTTADNVYIVKRGEGTLTVDGETHVIRENDVVYIPAGMTHSLANLSGSVFEIFEIYAPAGRQFDFVADEGKVARQPSDQHSQARNGSSMDREMTDSRGVLFVPYQDTLVLLSVEDALRICEDVYGIHARGSVVWSSPASFKLDVADGFNNH